MCEEWNLLGCDVCTVLHHRKLNYCCQNMKYRTMLIWSCHVIVNISFSSKEIYDPVHMCVSI